MNEKLIELLVKDLKHSTDPIYDFGCGDGELLYWLALTAGIYATGIELDAIIEKRKSERIIHPLDLTKRIHLGPPGHVICFGMLAQISKRKELSVFENIQAHVGSCCRLYVRWVGGRAQKVFPSYDFVFLKETTAEWRAYSECGDLYIFERP